MTEKPTPVSKEEILHELCSKGSDLYLIARATKLIIKEVDPKHPTVDLLRQDYFNLNEEILNLQRQVCCVKF